MYIKQLSQSEIKDLKNRRARILQLQGRGICVGCYNFLSGDIFPDEGLFFYEDEKVRCQFEKYPRAMGQTTVVSKEHYEDVSEMPLELGVHMLKITDAIIKLHKDIIAAQKVYVCTICDGERNHLHFQFFPRLKGEPIGYGNFVREEGIIADYIETVKLYRHKMEALMRKSRGTAQGAWSQNAQEAAAAKNISYIKTL